MEDIMRQLFVEQSFKSHLFPSSSSSSSNISSSNQPKPQHSYIGLIAMAILSSPQRKMVLSEVYEWIMNEYPYFRSRGAGWRNSIRHNLSLNDCFVKAGRAANGKGHYWAVHSACCRDFERGDFRRRRAQRKVRRHMGLSVDEEDSSDDDEEQSSGAASSPVNYFSFLFPPPPPLSSSSSSSSFLIPNSTGVTNRIKSFTIDAILAHS